MARRIERRLVMRTADRRVAEGLYVGNLILQTQPMCLALAVKSQILKNFACGYWRGEAPSPSLSHPRSPTPHVHAGSDERRLRSATRRVGGCCFRFPFSVSRARRG